MVPTGPASVTRLPPHRCRRLHRTAPYRPLDSPTGCHCERHHWRTAPRRLHDWCRLRHAFGSRRGGAGGGRCRARHAVHEYRDGVIEHALPGGGRRTAARTGPCRCPRTTVTCCGRGARRRAARAGSTRRRSSGSRTDFTACTMRAHVTPTARRCASCRIRRPPARLVEAVEAPRRAAAGRPHQRARRTSAARSGSPRYGGLISSEWEFAKALQLLEEDPEIYAADGPLDRSRRLDRLAAVPGVRRNACTAGYKGIYQDGALPVRGLPRRAEPGLRRLRRRPSWRTTIGRWATPPAG